MTTIDFGLRRMKRIDIVRNANFAEKRSTSLPWESPHWEVMNSVKHSVNLKVAADNPMQNYLTPCVSGRAVEQVPSQTSNLNGACKMHDLVTGAEILWTLKVITSHYSYKSFSQTNELFKRMFPDSKRKSVLMWGEQVCIRGVPRPQALFLITTAPRQRKVWELRYPVRRIC